MQLAVTLRSGAVLSGEEEDIQRLLRFTSAFGAGKVAVDVTQRTDGAAGAEESVLPMRWVNPTEVVYISEVLDG